MGYKLKLSTNSLFGVFRFRLRITELRPFGLYENPDTRLSEYVEMNDFETRLISRISLIACKHASLSLSSQSQLQSIILYTPKKKATTAFQP